MSPPFELLATYAESDHVNRIADFGVWGNLFALHIWRFLRWHVRDRNVGGQTATIPNPWPPGSSGSLLIKPGNGDGTFSVLDCVQRATRELKFAALAPHKKSLAHFRGYLIGFVSPLFLTALGRPTVASSRPYRGRLQLGAGVGCRCATGLYRYRIPPSLSRSPRGPNLRGKIFRF
jgi:hypothetical protein